MWREQAILEWSWHVNSVVVCCHSAKLCAYAAWDFRSQQNGAVTRMWRSCGVQPSHKERAIGAVSCKKEGMLLQPLRWCCVECVIHHELDVREEQHHAYMWREQAIIEWSWHVNSIVACYHSEKLCAFAARDFLSQQYFTKLLWQNNGRQNGLKSRMLFSELYKIMVKEVAFVGFSGDDRPNRPTLDPP